MTMDAKLKEQFDDMFLECGRLNKLGYSVNDETPSLAEFLKYTLAMMMIYISMCDRHADPREAQFINETLGMELTEKDLEKIGKENSIKGNDVAEALKSFCVPVIQAHYDGNTEYDSAKLVSFVNTVGINIIAADGNADEQQTAVLGSLTFRLRVFCESHMKKLEENKQEKERRQESSKRRAAEAEEKENAGSEESLEQLMEQLNSLVGLDGVKREIYSLSNLIKVHKLREERGFVQPEMSLHLVFTGNPGTGKTTVARLISKIYNRLGVIPTDKLVEVDRSGLVSGYVGKTAIKTKEVCESALGGVLFIDEAYTLTANASKNDFGIEAINTIMKFMEDNRGEFVLICAGYTDLMEEFLSSNPGLKSRFNRFIHFDDYDPGELTEIFLSLCADYKLEPCFDAVDYTKRFFECRCSSALDCFANGRDVRNFFERVISRQADRLAPMEHISDSQLLTITLEDVEGILL